MTYKPVGPSAADIRARSRKCPTQAVKVPGTEGVDPNLEPLEWSRQVRLNADSEHALRRWRTVPDEERLSTFCIICGAEPGNWCEDPAVPDDAKPGLHLERNANDDMREHCEQATEEEASGAAEIGPTHLSDMDPLLRFTNGFIYRNGQPPAATTWHRATLVYRLYEDGRIDVAKNRYGVRCDNVAAFATRQHALRGEVEALLERATNRNSKAAYRKVLRLLEGDNDV